MRELRRLGHRRPAHEAFADIDGRLPVDSALACEQRNALGGPERDDRVRLPGLERDARDLVLGGADDRELARRREVELERAQRPAERTRRSPEAVHEQPEDSDGATLEVVVAVDPREPQQDVRKHRVAGRQRVVVERLRENPQTTDSRIKVDVKQGVVVLGGEVPTWVAKRAAGDDAWDTPGVVDVSNQLVSTAVMFSNVALSVRNGARARRIAKATKKSRLMFHIVL